VFSLQPDTDTVTDILLYTSSITELFSMVVIVTKNRSAILRIMVSISEIDKIILPSSREYYRKANTSIIYPLLVICIFLGISLDFETIVWSITIRLKISIYYHMCLDTLIEWIVVIQFMNVVILLKNRF
jgi:hypothetical protein